MIRPSIPRGTRDFPPSILRKRQYILDTIRRVFECYGFQPLETPSMENMDTLTGKYGDEGDKLLFRILDNGDILDKAKQARDPAELALLISGKALRYDLTIPFARFVAMNQQDLAFPFRRYQIQPVWRADRPQKGRYREFYQCDADIIGSDSLLCEIELLLLAGKVFRELGLTDSALRINHRKLLSGLAYLIGRPEMLAEITTAIDKMDKISWAGVSQELLTKGLDEKALAIVGNFLSINGSNAEKLDKLKALFPENNDGQEGIAALTRILDNPFTGFTGYLRIDLSLARGLHYYTGTILEAGAPGGMQIGSLGGGGRYDNLTGLFGLPGISGVGFSFGVDRIFDVMEELKLFPVAAAQSTRVLFLHLGEEMAARAFSLLQEIRDKGIASEIYPSKARMDKQIKYADKRGIPYVAIIGEAELQSGKIGIKNLQTGTQETISQADLAQFPF